MPKPSATYLSSLLDGGVGRVPLGNSAARLVRALGLCGAATAVEARATTATMVAEKLENSIVM